MRVGRFLTSCPPPHLTIKINLKINLNLGFGFAPNYGIAFFTR